MARQLVTCGLFDEESGEGAEDECLNAASEPVKVQAGDGGDTHSQPGIGGSQVGENSENTQNGKDNAQNEGELLTTSAENNDQADANEGQTNGNPQVGAQGTEEGVIGSGQSGIDQSADNGAGENIAEMTAGHGYRGEALGHDIDGQQDEQGIQEPPVTHQESGVNYSLG